MCDMTHSFVICVWMSHVTHERVLLHINESCHTWMSHVTYGWVMSYMNESCHINESCHKQVVSYINASCHAWMCHATSSLIWHDSYTARYNTLQPTATHIHTYMHTHGWVMSRYHWHVNKNVTRHIWMNHVTYKYVVSHRITSCHAWMSHVTASLWDGYDS